MPVFFISCLATGHCSRLQILAQKPAVMTGEFLLSCSPPFRGIASNWAATVTSASSSPYVIRTVWWEVWSRLAENPDHKGET